MSEALGAGRRSFERQAWRETFSQLATADEVERLGPDDLERMAVAAFLIGEDAACVELTRRGYDQCMATSDAPRAARCAFWLAFNLIQHGEMAPASGWLARAQRALDAGAHDCVERGFLLVPDALGRLFAGDPSGALSGFSEALAIGERFGDADLMTLGRLGRGQALVLGGRQQEGVALFDLLMVDVTAGEVSPILAGLVYCAVIEMCQVTFDVSRAREWTSALASWCDAQPDLVAYRGQCLVHRAEILQLDGTWSEAMREATRACEHLSRPPVHPAVGAAWYRVAELRRLRGEVGLAEDAYRAASEGGHDPQPGLARLRLAQRQPEAAVAAIQRALDEAVDQIARAHLLAAYVEIKLAIDEVDAARLASDELTAIGADLRAPVLRATAGHIRGLVHLASGDPRAALGDLRPAWVILRDLHTPYEAARVRVAIGVACRQLGDEDGATLELCAAAGVFRDLGALGDLAAVEHLAPPDRPSGLSPRELQVLKLLATGLTNRAVATELVISEKTVARHVANIFTKLGVSSRSAATSYAYEHGLTERGYTQ